jgi:hypothetical protein
MVPNNPEHGVGSHTIVDAGLDYVMKQFEEMKKAFNGSLPKRLQNIRLPVSFMDLHDPERGIEQGEVRPT